MGNQCGSRCKFGPLPAERAARGKGKRGRSGSRPSGCRSERVAGITIRVPLFTGFEVQGRIRQAHAAWLRARDLRRDPEGRIALEVREAHRLLLEAEATLRAQAKTIEQAERALAIARVRYSNALGTQLEVTDAQLALAQARVVRLQAVHAHAVARAALRRAMGESLLPPGGSL